MSDSTQHTDALSEIENSLMPLVLMLARRIRFLILVPACCAALTAAYTKMQDPIYTATTRILPPQYNENTVSAITNQFGGQSQLGNSALTLKNPTDLFVGVLHSRTIRDAVIRRFNLAKHYGQDNAYDVVQTLKKKTTIQAGKDGIVSISVEDTDPQLAADLANAYVDEFYTLSSNLAHQEADRRAAFFKLAMDRAQHSLLDADQGLATFEAESGFTSLHGQDTAIVQAAAELRAEISAREVQLRTMGSYATDSNPDVLLIKAELKNLRDELARLRAVSTPDEEEPFVELGRVPEVFMGHVRSKREVAYWEDIVSLLGRFTELGKIDVRRDMSLFQVLDVAVPPRYKSGPKTTLNTLLTAIGVGLLCVFWILLTSYIGQRKEANPKFAAQWSELTRTLRKLGANAP